MPEPASPCSAADADELVRLFWERANARDWAAMGRLLAPGLRYEVPQTREFIDGRDGFVDFFATWPGWWRVEIDRLVAADGGAVALEMRFLDAQGANTAQTALGFYQVSAGLITAIREFWPAPYEPPPRASRHVQRQPA